MHLAPLVAVNLFRFHQDLWCQNPCAIVQCCFHDPAINHFDTIAAWLRRFTAENLWTATVICIHDGGLL